MYAIRSYYAMQMPSIAIVGTWKVSDFPPPVGMSPSVSFPDAILWIISPCKGRKLSYPQYFFSMSRCSCIFTDLKTKIQISLIKAESTQF